MVLFVTIFSQEALLIRFPTALTVERLVQIFIGDEQLLVTDRSVLAELSNAILEVLQNEPLDVDIGVNEIQIVLILDADVRETASIAGVPDAVMLFTAHRISLIVGLRFRLTGEGDVRHRLIGFAGWIGLVFGRRIFG